MFVFKKAINSFLALGVTVSSFASPNFVKADRHFMSWEELRERLKFETEKDNKFDYALLHIASCRDCDSNLEFEPYWFLVVNSGKYIYYAMVPRVITRLESSKNCKWKFLLDKEKTEQDKRSHLFISHTQEKTLGFHPDKLCLCVETKKRGKNKKNGLFGIPLCSSLINPKLHPVLEEKEEEKEEEKNKQTTESPAKLKDMMENLYDYNDKELLASIASNFLITEISSNCEEDKEKVISWPCWFDNFIGSQEFKRPKKEKTKKSDSDTFSWIHMLDNESLMWFS